jgi:methylthioribose-1-phosphate isomerase
VQLEIAPEGSAMANYAFDVTPAHLVSGLVTERGVCEASSQGLRRLFPQGARTDESKAHA